MKEITDYTPRQITQVNSSKYKQTENNCWLYAAANDLYDITRIATDIDDFKLYIKAKRVNPEKSGTAHWWVTFMEKYMSDKKVTAYMVIIFKDWKIINEKLLSKLYNAWYSLIYTRLNNTQLLLDILNDDEVDFIPPLYGSNQSWHVSTHRFDKKKKKIIERWSRWDDNVFNEFSFDNMNLFLQCVKKGVIKDRVFFLDIN